MSDSSQKVSYVTSLHNHTRTKVADGIQNVPKGLPGHVSKILPNDIVEFTYDIISPFTLPKVQVSQAFSKYHREPTQIGDKGYISPADATLSNENGMSSGTATLGPRGNLSTGVFHPISDKKFPPRDPNQLVQTGGPSGHKIQSSDGTTTKIIDKLNNIIHTTAEALMSHISGSSMINNAIATMSHSAPIIQAIAENKLVHAVMGGELQILGNTIHMAQPAPAPKVDYRDGSTVPPTPTPGGPVQVNVTGSLSASIGISAGSISASGGMTSGGAPVMTQPIPPQLIYAPVIVSGSRQGNVALANLLQGLQTLGLVTDQTSP